MNSCLASLLTGIPENLPNELCQTLLEKPTIRIERIVSRGHASDDGFWYDQQWDEWVLLLQGAGRLRFEDDREIAMRTGDYLLIPAHCKHRVEWTEPNVDSIWLAIHMVNDHKV